MTDVKLEHIAKTAIRRAKSLKQERDALLNKLQEREAETAQLRAWTLDALRHIYRYLSGDRAEGHLEHAVRQLLMAVERKTMDQSCQKENP